MSANPIFSTSDAAFGVARSFSGRRWSLRQADDAQVRDLARNGSISLTLARLLAARGVTPSTLQEVLNPTLKRLLPEPLTLKDMDIAVTRARGAIEQGQRIAIFGDYDVDGSCSAALLHGFFGALGIAPRIYIPDRMTEGYGPSAAAMAQLKSEGIDLVICVDCGATAVAALTAARDMGLDVIVLDHHAVETPPPSVAQVNPNQRGDESGLTYLCAAGVTFLFAVALNRDLREWYRAKNVPEPDLRAELDLVGLATICDVVPLVGVNRAFVRAGLAQMAKMGRPGLAALAAVATATLPLTPYHLGFIFGPRINAGGRVGRCSLGVELLTAQGGAATDFALHLDTHNRERQAIEKIILEDAIVMASLQDNLPFIFVHQEGWHPGVVGIVAGRLKDRFGKPALVVGFEGGMGRGSARSVVGRDIGAVMRRAMEAGLLASGGGHAMAAGFSLMADQAGAFQDFLSASFAEAATGDAGTTLEIDALVSPSGASPELVRDIASAGPYGAGNPEPLVALADVRLDFADIVGKDHVRLRLSGGDGGRMDAIAFRAVGTGLGDGLLAARGQRIHLAGRLKADEWNGRLRVQLQVEDAAGAGI